MLNTGRKYWPEPPFFSDETFAPHGHIEDNADAQNFQVIQNLINPERTPRLSHPGTQNLVIFRSFRKEASRQ